jgi:hypothetical protein
MRTTQEVFESHLKRRTAWDLDGDLTENYAEDILLFCEHTVLIGREAVRASADRLMLQLPGAKFQFSTQLVKGDYAFLVWSAESDRFTVKDGVDSFVIRDGRIVMQSIFYRLSGSPERTSSAHEEKS